MKKKRANLVLSLCGRQALLLWLLACAVLPIAGCRGCLSYFDPWSQAAKDSEDEKDKGKDEEEDEKPKEDFTIEQPIILPGDATTPIPVVKPGHWAVAAQQITANKFDFTGQSTTQVVDKNLRPVPFPKTPFYMQSTRPVLLLKTRPKIIESMLLVPPTNQEVRLNRVLRERAGARITHPDWQGLTRMAPNQYKFVVLARVPERYGFLKHVDSVRVPYDGFSEADDTEDSLHYRVLLPDISERVPLADNSLAWTATAYLLWDGIDPGLLTPEQQTALIDWLHWGGQLIVNGPDSLDLLAGSFLVDYLPAVSIGSRNITEEDLAPFNRTWLVRSRKSPAKPLTIERPWSGVALDIHEEATPLKSTGDLLVERQVGLGRIVVSAMQLSEREFINWNPHFQSILNACILRRPARKYRKGAFGDATLVWADYESGKHLYDARMTCGLRYFSHDEGVDTNYQPAPLTFEDTFGSSAAPAREFDPTNEFLGGVAAWNDFSPPAMAATDALHEAAGIEVPRASFVIVSVAAYLVVLVPLNWLFFHAIGRLEWAWIAAPLIAVAYTFVVVHWAQLDIGFVHAQTEIGILEIQPEYPRGHLTRYTALYTSLSTTYQLDYENLTTLAAPLGDVKFKMTPGSSRDTVQYHKHNTVSLSGVQVSSNSTNMVHSEQMLDLGGTVTLGTSSRGHPQIENRSELELKQVFVIKKPDASDTKVPGAPLLGMWVGDLQPRESRPLALSPIYLEENQVPFGEERDQAEANALDTLQIENLMLLACEPARLKAGESRLIARIEQMMPGQSVSPAASQVRATNLVVAHLEYPAMAEPLPDLNARADVTDMPPRSYSDEDLL